MTTRARWRPPKRSVGWGEPLRVLLLAVSFRDDLRELWRGDTIFACGLFVPCEAQTSLRGALRRSGHISLSLLYLPCFCCCTGSEEARTISGAGL
jgi:hypothetical protein